MKSEFHRGQPTEGELPTGTLLRIPYEVMIEALEAGLAAQGYGDLRSAHFPVFVPLSRQPGGMRLTDLAAWVRITKPSMVYIVDYLEKHGYAERVPSPTDKRAQLVRLTPRGEAAVQAFRALIRKVEEDWEARIGRPRLQQLKQILGDLVDALGH